MVERAPGWYEIAGHHDAEVYWNGTAWTDTRPLATPPPVSGATASPKATPAPATTAPKPGEPPFEPNPVGLAFVIIAAALGTIGVFLPTLQSADFSSIKDNTLIANGDGWGVLVVAALTVTDAYAAFRKKRRARWLWVPGLALIAGAIYDGTGSRAALHSLDGSTTGTVHASPDVGLYMVGVAGGALVLGGLMLAGFLTNSQAPAPDGKKRCPDCAETVLADARVCKHCGNRFA